MFFMTFGEKKTKKAHENAHIFPIWKMYAYLCAFICIVPYTTIFYHIGYGQNTIEMILVTKQYRHLNCSRN